MKYFIIALGLFSFQSYASETNLYQQSIKSAQGNEIKISDYKGKALLIVNIATRCGYTGQLDDLEALYQKYKDKGFVVLGIPSNDFFSQTPENDKKVVEFCRLKYGVSFPLTSKVIVKGKKKHPFAQYIVDVSKEGEIGWNFTKFVFNRQGKFVDRFSSSVSPDNKKLIKAIEQALKE